jgi:hypothetical protein
MPLAVTIDGLPSAMPPAPPPTYRPAGVERVLSMVRWSSAAGMRDVSPEVAAAVDDRLFWVKAGVVAGGVLSAITLVVVLAQAACRPPRYSRRRSR